MSPTLWYFAYGSNMARSIFIDMRRMSPLAAHPAWLDDYRLCFNIPVGPGERGVANVAAEVGARIHGVVYQLTATDFDRLDGTEGVPGGLYQRVPVTVLTAQHGPLEAWTYQSSLVTEGRKPSERYLRLLLDGTRENGLPFDYVEYLGGLERAIDERLPTEPKPKPKPEPQP